MSTATSGCAAERCITCGDVAVRMRVITVDADADLALCESESGERETVDVTLVAPVRPADRLLIHAGIALNAEQAAR